MTVSFMLHDNLRNTGRQERQKWAQGISVLFEHDWDWTEKEWALGHYRALLKELFLREDFTFNFVNMISASEKDFPSTWLIFYSLDFILLDKVQEEERKIWVTLY